MAVFDCKKEVQYKPWNVHNYIDRTHNGDHSYFVVITSSEDCKS